MSQSDPNQTLAEIGRFGGHNANPNQLSWLAQTFEGCLDSRVK